MVYNGSYLVAFCNSYYAKKIDKKMILFLSFIASLAIAGLPNLGLLSIASTITFFPFFVLGNICRDSARFIDKWGGKMYYWV